jgi:hypothetical protein
MLTWRSLSKFRLFYGNCTSGSLASESLGSESLEKNQAKK